MIRLVYSNRTEELAAALVEHLEARRTGGAHPLEPVDLVVPNRNMEAYLRFRIAEALGVAANLRFRRLERYVEELVATAAPSCRLVGHETLEGAILAELQRLGDDDAPHSRLAPLGRYLQGSETEEGRELRQAQLASRLTHLFEEYDLSRAEMLAEWPKGPQLAGDPVAHLEGWQRALWMRLFGPEGLFLRHPPPGGEKWLTVGELARGGGPRRLLGEGSVLVFGFSYIARAYQQLLARLGEEGELVLFALNPCQELWDDVETPGEHRWRLRRARKGSRGALPDSRKEDPFGLFRDTHNTPLRLWGRPGREGMRLFEELTDCDFEARFVDPLAGHDPTLLRRLQRDILERRERRGGPSARPPAEVDGSVRLLACPSLRREVETVAEEIWRLVAGPAGDGASPLLFCDIAVIVNAAARDRYLPQIEATFEELHGIPRSVTDLPLVGERRLAEGARLLLELPFGRFSRSELLEVMIHPAVAGRFDDLRPDEWPRLADRLGIRFGSGPEDLEGTYLEEDLVTWDQGIRRLALGAFMGGERSGDQRILEIGGRAYLPHELPAGAPAAGARFGLLARSLLADARSIRQQRHSLSQWAALFRELFRGYLLPADEAEEGDLLRCSAAMETLEGMDVTGEPVGGRVATWAAVRSLARLAGTRGSYLAEGVVVSSFLPMRALPFRVIFVLGLGEGLFPAANRRDAMDLRSSHRLAGDVSPAERDRYMFLETVLSARDRLYVSWVARDEHSGEPLHPSGVVQELEHLLAQEYVGEQGTKALTHEPPLHRFQGVDLEPAGRASAAALDDSRPVAIVLPGARAEAAARELGASARRALPGLPAREALSTLRLHLAAEAWRDLARFLRLPDVPPTNVLGGEPDTPFSLSFSSLRGILECPLQAAARAVLGLEREAEEDPEEDDDEPLAPGHLEQIGLLREVMGRALRRDEDPLALYQELARRRRLAGLLPAGLPGQIASELHQATLESWQRALEDVEHEGRVQRLRIGPARELEEVDALLPALEIPLPAAARQADGVPGDRPGAGSALELLRLHGPSPLLLDLPKGLLYLEPTGSGRLESKPRLLIRIYFDHLALCAAGLGAGEARKALVLRGPDARPVTAEVRLAPLDADQARELLASAAADLLRETHDAPLPCEAVFAAWKMASRDLQSIDGEALVEAIRQCLGPFGRSSSRYGPIHDPERYAPPAPQLAAQLARRRFAPLFRLLDWEGR
jgi:exodeoxyribonuclease V gamma subunit